MLFLVGIYGIDLRSSSSNIDFSMCMTSLEKIIAVVQELNKWHCDVVHRLKHNACDNFADFVIRSDFYLQILNHTIRPKYAKCNFTKHFSEECIQH